MKSIALKLGGVVFVVAFGFLLIRFFNIYLPVRVVTSSVSSELSVVGEGKVEVTADTGYIDVGVYVENVGTADEAQKQISERNNTIVKALKGIGVNETDIKTSNFSISPNYIYEGGRNRASGYNGNVLLSIKTKDISLISKIVSTVTQVGANQIQGIRFAVDEPEKYREEAREKAIANAREQAQKLASSLGITLGKVTNIVESSPANPPILYAEKAMGMGGGGGAPDIQAGSQTITSTITLYFEKR